MKLDRLKIRLLIGFVFIAVLYIIALFLEQPKENNNKKNENVYFEANQVNMNQSIVDDTNKIYNEEIYEETEYTNITKDDIFSLIEKGIQNNFSVDVFSYSFEIFPEGNLTPTYFDIEYKEIINYIDLYKYKENKFEFYTLKNTEEYIWGCFEENEGNENAYIIMDKSNWKIKAFNNNSIQLIVY